MWVEVTVNIFVSNLTILSIKVLDADQIFAVCDQLNIAWS